MPPNSESLLAMKRLAWSGVTIIALLFGLVVGLNLGYERSPTQSPLDLRRFRGVKDAPTEEGRTTDPTGRFDAVLLVESYGGAVGGGVNWYVSIIVQKDQPAISATELYSWPIRPRK